MRIKNEKKKNAPEILISLVRDYVLLSLSMLVSGSVTVAAINRNSILCAVIETDHIGITPHSDTKLRNACTTIVFFTYAMVDRLNFFVMNISCYWIPVYHRD
jgi:hypothetical protein